MICPDAVMAHNGAVALAYPIDGITIDGNLDDWPDDMRRYPIAMVESGDSLQDANDLKAWFRIGYNLSENAVYLAVQARDDSAVKAYRRRETDGCNVYIDSLHAEKDSAADEFITHGYHETTSVSKRAVQWQWKRQDDLYSYEWRLGVDRIGGDSTRLKSGMTIGLDIAICDKDGDGSFSWVSWGRGANKHRSQGQCGDVVLMAPEQSTGWLEGRVTWRNTLPQTADENVLIQSLASEDLWVRTKATREGVYRVELPGGSYQVTAGQGRRKSAHRAVEVGGSEQVQADLELLGAKRITVSAGAGRSVRAASHRLGSSFHLIAPYSVANVKVRAIAQSADRYLWLATNLGLVRYDGEAFTFFTTKDGLPGNSLFSLAVDRLGQLWIATNVGLCVYDGETFTHLTVEDGLIDNSVRSLLADSAGRLWIGTPRGASLYDGKAFTHFTTENGLRDSNITALLEDSSGRIWLGTLYGGVSIYDGERLTHLGSKEGLSSNRVRALLEDSLGRIWIGTFGAGVSLYDGTEFIRYTVQDGLADNRVLALVEDDTGRVWISGTWKGLSVYDDGKISTLVFNESPVPGGARTFLEDREGNLWWGTGSGLIRYDNALVSPVEASALLGQGVETLLEDSASRIWIGTASGVGVYDGKSFARFSEQEGLAGDYINSILEDRLGRIWFATEANGVSVYDGNDFTRYDTSNGLLGNQVKSLVEDDTGRVWIATNVGASVYDDGQFSHFTVEDGLADNALQTLLEDRTGRIWIGTAFGISVYDGADFTGITEKDGLADDDVTCLLEDRSGQIWIGTRSDGLSVYDGKRLLSFTKADGLVSDDVRVLLEDRTGQIWIGTWAAGISRYDGKSFQSLTREDGVPNGGLATLMEDQDGHIWIGTAGGIVRYRPGHAPPPVGLTDVVTNRRHGPIDRIRLASTQSLLAFEYRALSLKTRPGGMVYRYRLKGYDKQWQATHDQRVEYHDLPRGNYTFELQAVDRDLSYSEVPVRVAVAVHLPYGRIAFWSAVAVALALGHWQIVQIRRRGAKLRAARDDLELRVKQRTSELTRSNVMLTQEMAEREKIEAALAESEQRFRKFFENEPEYCYMVSPQGNILEANSAALSSLGYERQELVGRPIRTIYATECHQGVDQLLGNWDETDEVRDREMTVITRDGDQRTVLLSASRVLDGNGEAL